MSRKILVVYFSMTGNSRRIAEEIQRGLDARIEEIREPRPRKGLVGVIRALRDAMLRREPPISPLAVDPSAYDLVVLGGPIWAGRFASPVRTFARRFGSAPPRLALFCTQGGQGGEKACAELQQLTGRSAGPTLVIDARHLPPAAHAEQLQQFLGALQGQAQSSATASPAVRAAADAA